MDYQSPSFAEAVRRLGALLASLAGKGLAPAVLGAGAHTGQVLSRLDLGNYASCLYDDQPLECPPDGPCLPVRPLQELDIEATPAFVLCSHFEQENLEDWLLRKGVAPGKIHKMYTPADRVLQFQKWAFDPAAQPPPPPRAEAVLGPGLANSRFKPRFVNRVLLIHPPFALANRRHKKTMPMGLLALGGYLKEKFPGLSLELIDGHIDNLGPQAIIDRVQRNHYDLVCLTAWTSQAPMAYAVADAVRGEGLAGVVLGGVHATVCPDEAINHADFLITGEGELPLAGLVEALRQGVEPTGIPGLMTGPGQDPGRQTVEDLDSLPLPAWELLPDWRKYDFPLHVVGGFRFPIMGSRGCPFNCTFCSSPLMWQRRVRWHSPEYVAREMFEANRRYGVNQFHFWDDNLLLKSGHMDKLCELLLESGLDFKWLGLSRASDINRRKDLLPLMKKAGCVGMEIGIESFTQESADLTSKGEAIEAMAQAAENLITAGLAPLYTHMLFTPGEDLSSYPAKRRFLERINAKVSPKFRSDGGLGQLTTPHRGTVFSDQAPSLGMVLSRENAHYVHHRVNFIPESLLKDRPRRLSQAPGSPYPFLNTVVSYVHNWTLRDMENFVLVRQFLWGAMDGERSVKDLAGAAVVAFPELSLEKAQIFTALAMVGWAKEERITGTVRTQVKPSEAVEERP